MSSQEPTPTPEAAPVLLYTARIAVRWGDMDALGHVNNTIYFRFMEQCRVEWLDTAVGPTVGGASGPVIVSANCNFRRQLKYPATVAVEMHAGRQGRSSVETTYLIRDVAQPDIIYADGGAKVVWVDFVKEKSMALPDSLRQLLTGL